jgi:myo-inositol-1(or 4)-monophosphatase
MNLENFLQVAKEASLIGGLVLKEYFRKLLSNQVYFKGEKDVVSEADKKAEERIRDYILKHFPHHSVVGEEDGGSTFGEAVWYIDPLDGTKNFLCGFPIFGVSVGLALEGKPVVGAVYLPYFNSLYYAGEGTWCLQGWKKDPGKHKRRTAKDVRLLWFSLKGKKGLEPLLGRFLERFLKRWGL